MIIDAVIKETDMCFEATEGYTELSIYKCEDGSMSISLAQDDFIKITLTAEQAVLFKQWITK